jgi:membrane-bound serine protease (ClpP class)
MAAFIGRAMREALAAGATLVVLEMDTYGGRVDAAFAIVDTLLSFDSLPTLSYVTKRAISAGALIALACNDLYMLPATTLGDCAPISYTNEGPQMMGEKFQSPLRAKFRTLARRNGYPVTLSESMVSIDMVVYRVQTADSVFYVDSLAYEELPAALKKRVTDRSTVVARGELLTMDDEEALQLGFSTASVASLDELLAQRGIQNATLMRIESNWSERLVRLLTALAPVLMLLGFGGLYIEMRTPGFGLPGIVGLSALALAFFGQYMVGLASYTELLIVAIGVILLAFEVFVLPGFGLAGFSGLALIGLGMVLSMQDFVLPSPQAPWQLTIVLTNAIRVLGSFVGALLVGLLFVRFVLPRLGMIISGPYLQSTLKDAHSVDERASFEQGVREGARGVAQSALRPAGKALVNGEPCDVVTDGEFIEAGEAIVVQRVEGFRVVVTRERGA